MNKYIHRNDGTLRECKSLLVYILHYIIKKGSQQRQRWQRNERLLKYVQSANNNLRR